MVKMLKYLLAVTAAAIFWKCSNDYSTTVPEDILASMSIDQAAYNTNLSEETSELCLPRQISFAHSSRVQNSARRTTATQRNTIEFIRAGKIINAGQQYFVQRKSIILHASLTEPSHRLLYLGKLII